MKEEELSQKAQEEQRLRDLKAAVGMSRPSHLLCLAISAEHVNEVQIAALGANGWKVVKVQA